jgi:large repetitive protein
MRFTRTLIFFALVALVVTPVALALRFTDESYNTPIGLTGQSYSHTFQGAGGCGPALPYQYRVLAGGLPPGLSLSKAGTISGVPTQGGEWSFWIELSDQNPPEASWCAPTTAQREFSIKILQGLNIQQNALSPKATVLNAPYSFQLTAAGGGSQSWSVQSGSLPPGMALSSSGLLSGTPTAEGDFTFVVKVSDGTRSDLETYTLSVAPRLEIGKLVVPGAEIGRAFTLTPKVTGGRPAYSWSVTGDQPLPAGLTFDAATGELSGQPTVAGSYLLKITVQDQLGFTDTLDVPLKVAAKLAAVKKALPTAKVGTPYSGSFTVRGGVGPYKWLVLGGKPGILPPGLVLNAKTGKLSGTPRKAGIYRLRVQVKDKLGAVSSVPYVIKVVA